MTQLRNLPISLLDWETRYILQSISNELLRLKAISESDESDEAIDAANDYVELTGLYESLTEKAINTFGKQIANFSNELI